MNDQAEVTLPIFTTFTRGKAWMLKNRLLILLSLSAVCLSALLLYRTFKTPDYAELAEREYRNYLSTGTESSLQKLISLVNKDKGLEHVYDAPIARIFLEKNEKNEGLFFLARSLKPIKEVSSYHAEYARSTLTIADEKWEKALHETLQLKQKMLQDKGLQGNMAALYSSILMRLAFLEKKLGNSAEELLAWNELEKDLELSSSLKFREALEQKGILLEDLISNRKKALVVH